MNGLKERDFKPKRADIGFVFQDPGSSFNPLMTIAQNVAEPLIVHGKYRDVAEAVVCGRSAGDGAAAARVYEPFPHELSAASVSAPRWRGPWR